MSDDERYDEGSVAPPPLIYLVPLGLLLNRRCPVPFLPQRTARALAWTLLSGGVSLLGWFFVTLLCAGTTTRAEKPASRLVTGGPYRYTRNPGYLALALIYSGIASPANTLWAITLLPAALLMVRRGVIEREERYLKRKFGEEYLRYAARVRRWI